MVRSLRELNPEEQRALQRCLGAGAPPGAGAHPESVIRHLARLCGATTWWVLPAATEEGLLDHVGRRLGLGPHAGGLSAVPARERAVLAVYLRQGWEAAVPERRQEVLRRALRAWDHAALPPPAGPDATASEAAGRVALDALLQHPAGCRALASALEHAPLPLPVAFAAAGRLPPHAPAGHEALYGVLLLLWRSRARLLRERRAQRAHVDRQVRQSEQLLHARQQQSTAAAGPWTTDPARGLSIAAGAAAALGIQAAAGALAAPAVALAVAAGAAGLAWTASALSARAREPAAQRAGSAGERLAALRAQYARLDREIRALEEGR